MCRLKYLRTSSFCLCCLLQHIHSESLHGDRICVIIHLFYCSKSELNVSLFWKQEKSYRIYFIVFHSAQLDGLDTCDKEVMWSVKITTSRVVSRLFSFPNFLPGFGKFEIFLHLTDDDAQSNPFRLARSERRNKLLPVLRFRRMPKLNNIKSIHNFIRSSNSYIKRGETQPSNRSCLCCNRSPIWAIKSDYLISKMVSNEMRARAAVQLRRKFEEFYYYSAHDSE